MLVSTVNGSVISYQLSDNKFVLRVYLWLTPRLTAIGNARRLGREILLMRAGSLFNCSLITVILEVGLDES
jgi:hypothetical protein